MEELVGCPLVSLLFFELLVDLRCSRLFPTSARTSPQPRLRSFFRGRRALPRREVPQAWPASACRGQGPHMRSTGGAPMCWPRHHQRTAPRLPVATARPLGLHSVILRNKSSGETKTIKVGFSWILFLFAACLGIPLFLRRLHVWGAVFLALWIVDV